MTAGILSIIPGTGHLYCGRYKDATLAFILNTAMIYAACEAFDNHLFKYLRQNSRINLGLCPDHGKNLTQI